MGGKEGPELGLKKKRGRVGENKEREAREEIKK
jgi:hypothetical protein